LSYWRLRTSALAFCEGQPGSQFWQGVTNYSVAREALDEGRQQCGEEARLLHGKVEAGLQSLADRYFAPFGYVLASTVHNGLGVVWHEATDVLAYHGPPGTGRPAHPAVETFYPVANGLDVGHKVFELAWGYWLRQGESVG
jgi:hypothetical protein